MLCGSAFVVVSFFLMVLFRKLSSLETLNTYSVIKFSKYPVYLVKGTAYDFCYVMQRLPTYYDILEPHHVHFPVFQLHVPEGKARLAYTCSYLSGDYSS